MMPTHPETDTIHSIIQKIASLQSRGDIYFPEGIFPSYRQNKYLLYKRPDTNIFYTASIVFVLNQLKSSLPLESQLLVKDISKKAVQNYPTFQNKDGLKTYNFWQTPKDGRESNHFPNGYIFRYSEHFRLPDDIDDTSLVYLTSKASKEEIIWLKEKLQLHANLSEGPTKKRQVKNTFTHYKALKVYSTWFGKNMAIEFDACALCNLMYLFESFKLPHNEYDMDTYQYLIGIIRRKEFISHPFQVSHNYATAPLFVYHLSRLLGEFATTPLESYRKDLIEIALLLMKIEKVAMNKILLQTSLLKLSRINDFGYKNEIEDCLKADSALNLIIPDSDFCYFLGPLLSSYENPILQFFAPLKITQMDWKCEAHEWVLVLENLIERNKN
ncbi:hypothetical protein [Emticicia sp. C21]|uniref:hypothetical protein n=1 Tax=Emticicia sp. C21 TaxID=2302915 RepID=UPI000E34F7F9|nr:hypothetical protein [Emticicia sp. C21]RFS15669.1 hypothetical protein D0T08_16135 [Emticicia sp. C21]